ncbi:MAG: phosphoribosylanthranilate isomerase [Pyrinomonas sp.]|uniref:phosphoribosylanthranilate isomerase n=1 Tax=Pyrinomonas sp. TaxID=2080306 RepID=UPI00331F5EF8
MVRVKICGVTCLEDALAAVGAGADAVGFNFYDRSPRYVAPQEAAQWSARLPASVLRVGVFVNAPEELIVRVTAEVGLDAVQLHGDETPDFCRALRAGFELRRVRVIKALRVDLAFDPTRARDYAVDAVLLDAAVPGVYGGTGRSFDWERARQVKASIEAELFLAGGLAPHNVAQAVLAVRPDWVDACSALESVPGRKDHAQLADFVRAAKGAA